MRLLVVALVCAACDTGVRAIALGPLDANPACEEAKTHSDLPWIQTHIFDKSCASSTACHKDLALQAAELSLSDGKSYASLVGVDAKSDYGTPVKGRMQWKRVVAGDLATSYLMVMLDPHEVPPGHGYFQDPNGLGYGTLADLDPLVGPMPQNGEILCPEKLDAIKRWIESGAPEQ